MIDKIAARLGGADARKRAGAFCAQIAGLVVTPHPAPRAGRFHAA
ncbi:hypothetical protein [Streptomyces sp. NPDC048496]